MPVAQQPLKPEQHRATAEQRMEMVRLACADNPWLVPSDLELRREPPSYTVDTLRALRPIIEQHTDAPVDLWFVMGADALQSFPRWHAAADILGLARLAVVERPGAALDIATLDRQLPGLGACVTRIDGPYLDISATNLRERIARGQPVRYLVPDTVLAYIQEQRLYMVAPAADAANAHRPV
jgi:nicotinate-nucleotide adenylyltransferase